MSDAIASVQLAGLNATAQTQGRWVAVTFVMPHIDAPGFHSYMLAINEWSKAVKPWLLEDINPNPSFVVAADFTWLNRLRVWWLNIGRRAQAKKLRALRDARLTRERIDLSPLNVAHLSMQDNNTKDAPRA